MSTRLAIWPDEDAGTRLAPSPRIGGSACDIRRALAVVPRPAAGLHAHLLCYCTAAAAAGWRFTFVGPACGGLADLRDALRALPRTEYIGVPVTGSRCCLWPAVRSLLRDGGFDLIHSHGLTAAAHAVVGGFGFGAPHIVTLHEPLPAERMRGLTGRFLRWGLGWLLRRADAIAVAGEDARVDLLAHLPLLARRPDRIVVIPSGVPKRRAACTHGDGSLRRRIGVGGDTRVIGFFGPFTHANGFDLLLDAVEGLAAPPFRVAALGHGDPCDGVYRQVVRRGLAGRVTPLETSDDICALLGDIDLVVAPAPSLEASHAAMAAMAAGIPVLGADTPGLRDLFGGTPCRTVAAGDADALTHGLALALRRPWTVAAREYAAAARERFDARRSATRLLAVFDGLTGKATATSDTAPEPVQTAIAA